MVDSISTEEMQNQLHNILQDKFGNNIVPQLEGGKRKKASKKTSKKASKSMLEGGKRKKASKKASKKTSKKASKSMLEGGKRKKASKKASKKTSKKASKSMLEGGKAKKASKKTSKKASKKSSKKASKKSSKTVMKRELNPYMKARSALVKVMFAKAKAKGVKLNVSESAGIIKKIEEEIIQKHKLTDKVEILKKALEHFNSNVDKYLKN